MVIEKKYRRVIKIALLTIPLQVFFSKTELLSNHEADPTPQEGFEPIILFLLIFLMIAVHLVMWGYNIVSRKYYFKFFKFGKTAIIIRCISSYLVAILSTVIAVYILSVALKFELDENIFKPILSSIAANTIILIILELLLTQYEFDETKEKFETDRLLYLEAKLERLKQQLHPHFLFNSLNTLKTLINKHPEDAEKYLVKLSEFLRFSIEHHETNLVRLTDEIKFATDYLSLQQMRFPEGVRYFYYIPDYVLKTGNLPLFSVQLLFENAIKHNTFSREQPLFIKLTYREGILSIANNIQPKNITRTQNGMGLKNLNLRYQFISGDSIRIEETAEEFKVCIKVL